MKEKFARICHNLSDNSGALSANLPFQHDQAGPCESGPCNVEKKSQPIETPFVQKNDNKYGPRFFFDFTSSGLFTLVNQEGDSLYEQILPFFEKSVSHLLWISLWLTLILLSHLFLPQSMLNISDFAVMALIFFHLFFFGCRVTPLLLKGGLKQTLFPPLWIRLTRKLQKGKGIELLEKHNLHAHPGLLTNLALAQVQRGELNLAYNTLQLALMHAPNHPIITNLSEILLTHIPQPSNV